MVGIVVYFPFPSSARSARCLGTVSAVEKGVEGVVPDNNAATVPIRIYNRLDAAIFRVREGVVLEVERIVGSQHRRTRPRRIAVGPTAIVGIHAVKELPEERSERVVVNNAEYVLRYDNSLSV